MLSDDCDHSTLGGAVLTLEDLVKNLIHGDAKVAVFFFPLGVAHKDETLLIKWHVSVGVRRPACL